MTFSKTGGVNICISLSYTSKRIFRGSLVHPLYFLLKIMAAFKVQAVGSLQQTTDLNNDLIFIFAAIIYLNSGRDSCGYFVKIQWRRLLENVKMDNGAQKANSLIAAYTHIICRRAATLCCAIQPILYSYHLSPPPPAMSSFPLIQLFIENPIISA